MWSIKFSPDGEFLAVGVGLNAVHLWKWSANPSERRLIRKVNGCTKSRSFSSCEIEWSSDSKFFATRWEKDVLAYDTQGMIAHTYH